MTDVQTDAPYYFRATPKVGAKAQQLEATFAVAGKFPDDDGRSEWRYLGKEPTEVMLRRQWYKPGDPRIDTEIASHAEAEALGRSEAERIPGGLETQVVVPIYEQVQRRDAHREVTR